MNTPNIWSIKPPYLPRFSMKMSLLLVLMITPKDSGNIPDTFWSQVQQFTTWWKTTKKPLPIVQRLSSSFIFVLTKGTAYWWTNIISPRFKCRAQFVTSKSPTILLELNKLTNRPAVIQSMWMCCGDLLTSMFTCAFSSTNWSKPEQILKTAMMLTYHSCTRRVFGPTTTTSDQFHTQVVKLLEHLIQDKIIHSINVNGVISYRQYGFQSKCSCIIQLLDCLNDWTENYDNCMETDMIYVDFGKAFHAVPHQRLLFKLKKVSILGKVLSWVKSFLFSLE